MVDIYVKNPKYPLKIKHKEWKNRPGVSGRSTRQDGISVRPDGKQNWEHWEMAWRQDGEAAVLTCTKSHRQEVRPDATPDGQRAGKWSFCLSVRTRPLPSGRELESKQSPCYRVRMGKPALVKRA